MIKGIAIINKSTVVSSSDAAKIAAACNLQITRDVAPLWGRSVAGVTYYASESSVPASSAKLYIFDNTDQAGALGYHDETMAGQVYAKVFAKTIIGYGCPILFDSRRPSQVTVSSVVSHEAIELFCNPYVDLWADGTPIPQGSEYAYEACDAVEANVYTVTFALNGANVTASVSNFLTPEYFDTATPKGVKMDYMNLIKTPFTMTPNGYMIVRNGPGTETAIYGAAFPKFLLTAHL